MSEPLGAIKTTKELREIITRQKFIYGIEPRSYQPAIVYKYKLSYQSFRPEGWNLNGRSNLRFQNDYLFANYFHAWAYAQKWRV